MADDSLWYVTRTDDKCATTYALGGGLYGAKAAALRMPRDAAWRELQMAIMEHDGALMCGMELVECWMPTSARSRVKRLLMEMQWQWLVTVQAHRGPAFAMT